MRNTFINDLLKKSKSNENIVLIVGDLGYSVVEPFADNFPKRFINAGVAEQNMTGLAAGMASEGYHVFTYSIGNFPTFRCAEQIRNDIDYHNYPVTIVSIGGGLAYGNLGYSHHTVQDFSLIRSMPNMIIAAPGDPYEVSACLDFLIANPQPSYFRINKSGESRLHSEKPNILPGEPLILRGNKNTENIILSTGAVSELAINIWNDNLKLRDKWCVGSLPIWGESHREFIKKNLKKYDQIVSFEEHLLSGGFGSFLMESGLKCKANYLHHEVTGQVGSQKFLKHNFGLNNDLKLVLK